MYLKRSSDFSFTNTYVSILSIGEVDFQATEIVIPDLLKTD